jgi:hypothetical protein
MYFIALYHRWIAGLIAVYFPPHGGDYFCGMTLCGLVVQSISQKSVAFMEKFIHRIVLGTKPTDCLHYGHQVMFEFLVVV